MIDLHSHLLPGVDDGSRSIETSVSVLERFASEGVTTLVCTPHLNASKAAQAPFERHREILEMLIARAPAVPRLLSGWEIMLDIPGVDLRPRHLTLGGSTAVLVEFPRRGLPAQAEEELARIVASGLVPVVAHPERYFGLTMDLVRRWRGVGAVMQMDAAMVTHRSDVGEAAREMVRLGLTDCIASDNHGDGRSMAQARDWLAALGAEQQAMIMTTTNPQRLLNGEPIMPVDPVPGARSFMRRMSELLMGKRR